LVPPRGEKKKKKFIVQEREREREFVPNPRSSPLIETTRAMVVAFAEYLSFLATAGRQVSPPMRGDLSDPSKRFRPALVPDDTLGTRFLDSPPGSSIWATSRLKPIGNDSPRNFVALRMLYSGNLSRDLFPSAASRVKLPRLRNSRNPLG